MKKNILLTFDYEVYLGKKSGTLENCLLKPTQHLQAALNKYKVKAIFFVDTMGLQAYEKIAVHSSKINEVKAQLKELYNQGHYIFPHIHPHWLDAKIIRNSEQFDLGNTNRYALFSLDADMQKNLIENALNWFRSIEIDYEVWGYRAGGWAIQPFNLLAALFKKNQILHEFSVIPGYKNNNPFQFFDYSMVDNNYPYRFSNDVEIEDKSGEFIEYPITALPVQNIHKVASSLVLKYLWKKNDRGYGDGISSESANSITGSSHTMIASVDSLNKGNMSAYKRYLLKNNYIHFVSHPKMFTKHSLWCLETLLKWVSGRYATEYDYQKMELGQV